MVFELVFDLSRQPPQRDGPGGVEKLLTPGSSDSEDDPCLGEAVRPWKTTPERDLAVASKHSVRVPPSGAIHFTVAANNKTKFEQVIQVDHGS